MSAMRRSEAIAGYAFFLPTICGVLLLTYGQMAYSFYISLTNWNVFGAHDFVGLSNYVKLLTEDIFFWKAMRQTLLYAFGSVICAQLAALAHGQGKNVWTYTGYTWEILTAAGRPDWDALLAETDVLVDGPFVAAQKSYDALFRGSTNQRLIDMAATRAAGRVVLWTRPNPLGHFTIPES